jgi:C4-dicarboxylate transporter, DctM subunit
MENMPQTVAEAMMSLSENRIVLLLVVNVFLFLVGILMDEVSGILLSAPMLLPS